MSDHVHSCPKCYEDKPCDFVCEIEPDLGTTAAGLPRGYHSDCSECETPRDCERCHETMHIAQGLEPTPLCNACAQEIATDVWRAAREQTEPTSEAQRGRTARGKRA